MRGDGGLAGDIGRLRQIGHGDGPRVDMRIGKPSARMLRIVAFASATCPIATLKRACLCGPTKLTCRLWGDEEPAATKNRQRCSAGGSRTARLLQRMCTVPAVPSTSSIVPSATAVIPGTLSTAGTPSSLATIAA